MSDEERRTVAEAIRAAKLAGASGDEMRQTFGERLTGPARRKVLREHDLEAGAIARSYVAYRDGDERSGTRHAKEHGALAEARKAEARKAADAELAAALCAPKGRTKASKAAHAERVRIAEATVAALV
jgi:hypothetical protein